MRMPAATPKPRSPSVSTSRKRAYGARPSTDGRERLRSTLPTPLPTTTWRSATSTKGSSTRHDRLTKRRSKSTLPIPRFGRTLSSSRKSMIGLLPPKNVRNLLLAGVVAMCAAATLACGPSYFEIPIETPIQPKLDVSAFQRVLIAGFVAGGTDDVDANQETVRLLRSQLRSKSSLRVIDADVMQLQEIAQDQSKGAPDTADDPPSSHESSAPGPGPTATAQTPERTGQPLPAKIKEEKDLEPYERLFANTSYWKRIGEEYQNPLIV